MNNYPIYWYSNSQETVESRTFVTELCAMKAGVGMVEALHYKLQMFGVPIYGYTNMFCDNEAIYNNTITPESVMKNKHHSIS